MNEKPLAAWQRPDNFSVRRHQEIIDRLNQRAQGPTTGLTTLTSPFGQTNIDPSDTRTWIPCKVKMTGSETGIGLYKGFLARGAAIWNPADDLDEPAGQTIVTGTEDCLIGNTLEGTDPPLSSPITLFPSWAVGFITGKSTDGRYFVEVTIGTQLGAIFRVDLTKTSGSGGSKIAAASWVYTATDLDGTSLGTGLSPERGRPIGARAFATKGEGYFDVSGNFVLTDAWETYGTWSC